MERISSKHLIFLIWGIDIVSIKTNLNIYMRDGGRDTWIAIIISSTIIFLFMLYCLPILTKMKKASIVSLYQGALGKTLGNILLITLLVNLFMTMIESSAVEANAMHTNIFLETPHWYLLLFFVIPAIYTVKNGLVPLVSVTIIGVLLAMLAGINLVILTSKYKEYKYLLPIFGKGVGMGFYLSILKSLGLYSSLIIVFPFVEFVDDKKRIIRYSIIAMLVVIQMHIVSVVGGIVSFGIDRANELIYPKLIQTQQINYFGFLESGEFFVMFQIIGGWFMKYTITFFVLLQVLKEMRLHKKYMLYAISIAILLISNYISESLFRLDSFLSIYCYTSLINFLAIPFVVFLIYKIRNRSKPVSS